MPSFDELRQVLGTVGPIAMQALKSGQLFKPACHLEPPHPDILAEYDVRIPISEGFHVTANVFRSRAAAEHDEPMPVVMCAHPYDNRLIPALGNTPMGGPPQQYRLIPQEGAPTFSEQTSWESPDPNFWVPNGYAVVNMNLPGYGSSEGLPSVFSAQQGKAYYEAIDWVAEQPWCDGNIGLNGVSFLAISQYHVAACKAYGGAPKALRAISPWEGVADVYRYLFRPGGVWEASFPLFWWFSEVRHSMNGTEEDFIKSEGGIPPQWREQHPTFDDWCAAKTPDLAAIDVPTLLCASFSDMGVHTPGGFRAFMEIGSEEKWLYTHRGLKWDVYYSTEVQELTKRFFDCFVRGQRDNGFLDEPRVRLEVRTTRDEIVEVRGADAWPLPETDWRRLYLDASTETLSPDDVADASEVVYDARVGRAVFRHRFDEDTEISGHMALHLWIEARDDAAGHAAADPLLMVVVEKLDAQGECTSFYGAVGAKDDPVTRGLCAVALREETDDSTEWLPTLTMRNPQPVKAGEVVKVAIEIYPHSTLFRAGETLELTIAGHAIVEGPPMAKDFTDNSGAHVIHTGGARSSYLLVPVIPR